MEFVPLIAALAFATKLVDFIKYITNRDTNGIITQLAVWIAGVFVIALLANTNFAGGISIGDIVLDQLNWASLILVGVSVGSTGSLAIDFQKSIDSGSSSKRSPLLPD